MLKLKWSDLNTLGQNRFSRTSYVWIIVVPLIVKISRFLERENGIIFDIDSDLPFSWYLFFYGALFFALASTVYYLFCPEIIRKFKNFGEFNSSGHTTNKIYKYATDHKVEEKVSQSLQLADLPMLSNETNMTNFDRLNYQKRAFEIAYDEAEQHHSVTRHI